MNEILKLYDNCKHVESFDDLASTLLSECRIRRRNGYPESLDLFEKCRLLAFDYVRWLYVSNLRPRASVSNAELTGNVECTAAMIYAILKAGAIKTLYLMTAEASQFINSTAFDLKLEPKFFIDNFSRPLVLYAGEPKSLFVDVLCIENFYDERENALECILSCSDPDFQSHIFYHRFYIEELVGTLKYESIAIAESEAGEHALYIVKQGIVDSVATLNKKFYAALLYAFKFVLLMQCEKRTLEVRPRDKRNNNPAKTRQIFGTLSHQRVSLTAEYRAAIKDLPDTDTILVLDKKGKELRVTKVRGFLRRQHYGPGNSMVKTVFIDAHESHSWMKTGLRIIKVKQ